MKEGIQPKLGARDTSLWLFYNVKWGSKKAGRWIRVADLIARLGGNMEEKLVTTYLRANKFFSRKIGPVEMFWISWKDPLKDTTPAPRSLLYETNT